jgi:Uma2 family endonuclease
MVTQTKSITTEAFEQFVKQPQNAGRRFALVNGEIVEKMPTQLHALIASLLIGLFIQYRQSHPFVWVFSEVRIKLSDDETNDRIPDVAVVLREGRTIDLNKPLSFVPDFVIQIQSPGQSDKYMSETGDYYLAHDAKLVWLIYPRKRLVEVRTLDDRQLLNDDDLLDAGSILSGFHITVNQMFDAALE